jgi:hypothetical protein
LGSTQGGGGGINQGGGIGPTFPAPQHPFAGTMEEPTSKRLRTDGPNYVPSLPPQPLPLGRPQSLVLPPVRDVKPPPQPMIFNDNPFATAATGALPDMSTAGQTPAPVSTGELLSEADFVASLSNTKISVQVRIPNDATQMAWNFYGQIVTVSIDVMSDVKSFKAELCKEHLNSIATNKIQLKNTATGTFLKDALSLAALNIGPGTQLELVPRARGGKKK